MNAGGQLAHSAIQVAAIAAALHKPATRESAGLSYYYLSQGIWICWIVFYKCSSRTMEFILRFIVIFLALIVSGCETEKFWSGSEGDAYVKIVPQSSSEDVESELKQSGREYYCQALYASTYANNKICYAKLTTEDKIKNIEIKLQKTPETLVIDTGRTIIVVCSVALDILMHSNIHKG